jgi:mannosyl-3-phosphoglycerate phosphatase
MARASLVLFSDLDGTLLDHDSYAFDAAREALARLRRDGVPLVLCSSKTRAEIEALRAEMGNAHPFVVENGGAVFIPDGYFPFAIDGAERRDSLWVVPIGDAYDGLVAALGRASRTSGVAVRGFAGMSDAEVAGATSLPLARARLARRREFDEPFEILDRTGALALLAAIEAEGKRWTAGGRFHHILGASDKGAAVRLLADLYRRHLGAVTTIGLGDAPNDESLLRAVDIPVLIRSPRLDRLRALVPNGRVTRRDGPAGWNDTVLELLAELR